VHVHVLPLSTRQNHGVKITNNICLAEVTIFIDSGTKGRKEKGGL